MTHDYSPTAETYGDFQAAYQALNMALFDGRLPDVMFTLARTRHANGYIIPEGFNQITGEGQTIAEIGLNPETFAHRTAEEILSTIAHEMCHFDQHLHGRPSPFGYHNREFSRLMFDIGLQTSDTGKPGGAPVGPKMSHYVIPGGRFQLEAQRLIADGWAVRYASPVIDEEEKKRKAARKASKTKYTCRHCGANAWAKPGANLVCGDHGADYPVMIPQD